jgi:hypothetical protein
MAITTTWNQYRIIYLLVTALVLSLAAEPPRAYPAEKPSDPGALIIVDFTGSGTGSSETPAVYFFYKKTLDHIITTCGESAAVVVEDGVSRPDFLKQLAKKFKRASNKRWISKVNHQLKVFTFFKGNVTPTMQTIEKARKTALKDHITLLVKLVVKEAARAGEISMTENTYTLAKRRAQLTVTVSQSEGKKVTFDMITGPQEHWFLSADLTVVKLSDVKFTTDKGTVDPQETPKQFYVGLNFMLGDILSNRQALWKNFFFKGMIKFSKNPLDSYGLGIGYRFPPVKFLGLDISALSIFGALTWTKERAGTQAGKLTKYQWQLGISYNLDKALSWVK